MTSETGDVWRDARTNLGPGWLMWLIFPHHVHYHLEHHLYPSLPHYNLPRAHRALRDAGHAPGRRGPPGLLRRQARLGLARR